MATYATLQTDIAGFMNRTDLTAQIPGFILFAETRMNLDVRAWQMLKLTTLTIAAGATSAPVPVDWLEWDELSIGGNPLEYATRPAMQELIRAGNTATIARYTMLGGNLIVGAPGAAVAVDTSYYASIAPLAGTSTNWLLDTYPSLYLYASLVSACDYTGDDQGTVKYSAVYEALCRDINSNATKAVTSGSTWRQRTR